MKQGNTVVKQRKEVSRSFCKSLLILIFMGLWTSQTTAHAQVDKVFWDLDKTIPSGIFAVAGEAKTLDIYFTLPQEQENVSVKVVLPPYFNYGNKVVTGTEHTAGDIGAITTSGKGATGITVTIPLGTVEAEQVVHLQLSASATKKAEENDITNNDAHITVLAGEETLGETSCEMTAVIPMIKIVPDKDTQNYANESDIKTYKLNLTSTGVEAGKFEIRLSVPSNKVALDNLELAGKTLIEEEDYMVNEARTLYTIKQTEPGIYLDEEVKILSFTAQSTVWQSQTITVSARYPSFSLMYSEATPITLQMVFGIESGTPIVKHYTDENDKLQTYFVASLDENAPEIARQDIPMDVATTATTTYVKTVFINLEEATATAAQLKFSASTYGSFAFIDINDIHYQIEGEDRQSLPVSFITSKTALKKREESSSERVGYLNPLYVEEFNSISGSLPDDVYLPVGKKLTLWIATKNGVIYDNGDKNVYYDGATITINGFTTNITSCKSKNGGIEGTVETRSSSIPWLGAPHFRELPVSHIYRPEEKPPFFEQKIRIGSSSMSGSSSFEVKVELPYWLEMDDSYPYEWQLTSGTKYLDPSNININDGIITFPNGKSTGESNLTFRFKVKEGTYEENLSDVIRYRINLFMDGSENSRMNNISQVTQPVNLHVVSGSVQLEKFELRRTTLGYKDLDDNGIPDDGTLCDITDDNIEHTIYLQGDEGMVIWEGRVLEDYDGGTLYLPAMLSEKLPLKTITFSKPIIYINEGETALTEGISFIPDENTNEFLIRYTGDLSQGTTFKVELPFKVISFIDTSGSIQTKCLISIDDNKTPTFDKADGCEGNDQASSSWATYRLQAYVGGYGANYRTIFYDNNTLESISLGSFNTFHSQYLTSPYFKEEARCLGYPEKLEWDFPEGYELINNQITMTFQYTGKSTTRYTTTVTGKKEDGKLVFYLESLFDFKQIGTNPPDAEKGKVFPFPDDRWVISMTGSLRALKNAPASCLATQKVTYKNLNGDIVGTPSRGNTFNYVGGTVDLNLSETTKKVPALDVTTQVTVGNPNEGLDLAGVWLYVDGPVKDIAYLNGENRTEAIGNGKWLVLGEIKYQESPVYNITFTRDTDIEPASGDYNVTFYTVTGFSNQTWEPETSKTIQEIELDYLGRSQTMKIQPQPSQLFGSIDTDITVLTHNSPYTVTAVLSTEKSKGSVKAAAMHITIPPGQEFTNGWVEYNGKTDFPLSDELKAALSAGNTASFIASDYITDDILLGNEGLTSANEGKQKITLKMTFTPNCDTDPGNTRFSAVLFGEKPEEGEVTGSGNSVYARQVLAKTTADFSFNVSFTEVSKLSYLSGTKSNVAFSLSKVGSNLVKQGTYLELTLPAYLDVDPEGTITMDGAALGINSETVTLSEGDNKPDESTHTRTIRIELPASKYAGAGSNGQGMLLTYTIPVVYTAPTDKADLKANPVKEISTCVWTMARFGDCVGNEIPVPIGIASENTAFLLTADMPLKVFAGEEASFEVLSNGFNGTVNGESLTDGVYTFTPSTLTYNEADGVLMPGTIVVKFDDIEYGTISGDLFRIFPSLVYDLQELVVKCGSVKDITLNSYISNQESTLTSVIFYSDEDCTQKVDGTEVRTIDTNASYYARAYNNGVTADMVVEKKEIRFTINPLTVIEKNLDNSKVIYIDHGKTTTLSITALNASGYAWYKDGLMQDGKTENKLTVGEAGKYYALALSASCDNAKSKEVTVEVYPNLAIDVEAAVILCDEALVGINLPDLVTAADGVILEYYEKGGAQLTETEVKPMVTTVYEVRPKNAGGTYGTTKEITVTVEKTTRITTDLADQTFYTNGRMTLTVVAKGENLTYQWFKYVDGISDTPLTAALPDNNQYIKDNITSADAGRYYVVVTGTSDCNRTATSKIMTANVTTPSNPQDELYRITYEANWASKVSVTYNGSWTINSGEYVNRGTRLEISASPGMPGLILESLTVNGTEIGNGDMITVDSDTHIVARFELDGSDPNPDPDPTGNTEIGNSVDIRTERGYLYIRSEKAGQVRVINFAGRTYADCVMVEGETAIPLPSGFYIVLLSDGTTKKVVVKD